MKRPGSGDLNWFFPEVQNNISYKKTKPFYIMSISPIIIQLQESNAQYQKK